MKRDKEINEQIKALKASNKAMYKILKQACAYNDGHIASYKAIMQAGK